MLGIVLVAGAQSPTAKREVKPRKTPVGCAVPVSGVVTRSPQPVNRVGLSIDLDLEQNADTRRILRILERHRARATFFVIGERIDPRHPRLYRDILRSGSELGNHTFHHLSLLEASLSTRATELSSANRAIRRATGFRPCLVRPPYLAFDASVADVARSQGLTLVSADAYGGDWLGIGPEGICDLALDTTKPGSILLLHNTSASATALPEILTTLEGRGLRIVTVTKLLGGHRLYECDR